MACRWCDQGECWTHGQIEKTKPQGKNKVQGKGNGNKAAGGAGSKNEFMEMMTSMMGGSGGKGAMMAMMAEMMGQGVGKAQLQNAAFSWKSELHKAYSQTHKESPGKDSLLYATEEVEGEWTCALVCEKFESDSEYEGKGSTRKAAEDAAAKAAVKGEFPSYAKAAQKLAQNVQASQAAVAAQPMTLQPWRGQLSIAFAKTHKEIDKTSITYTTQQVPDDHMHWISSVASAKFESSYTGEPGKSKREAEDNAAIVAMKAEFPDAFKAASQVTPTTGKALKKKMQAEGEKRKQPGDDDAKGRLNSAMLLVSPTPIVKGVIEYSTVEEGENTIATVTLNCLGGKPRTFKGEPVEGTTHASKKKAEASAAVAACTGLKTQIEAAEAEHNVKKAAKLEVKMANFKVLHAKWKEEEQEKKAAKKAKIA